MKKFVGLIAMIAISVGCQNTPHPTLNLYAPYGTPRVQPPATGAYGSPNTYYPQTNAPSSFGAPGAISPNAPSIAPPSAQGAVSRIRPAFAAAESPRQREPVASSAGGALRWRAIGSAASDETVKNSPRVAESAASVRPSGQVVLAGFTKPASAGNIEKGDRVKIVEQAAPSGTKLKLRGMPLNDFTSPAPVPASIARSVNTVSPLPTQRLPAQRIATLPRETPVRSITVSAAPANTGATAAVEIGQLPSPRLRLRGLTPASTSGAAPLAPQSEGSDPQGNEAQGSDANAAENRKASSSPPGRLIPASMALPSKSVLRDTRTLATRFNASRVAQPKGSLNWKGR